MRVYYEPAGSIFFGNNFQSPLWVSFFKAVLLVSIGLSFLQLYLMFYPSQAQISAVPHIGHVKGVAIDTKAAATTPETPAPASGGSGSTNNGSTPTTATTPQCGRPGVPTLSAIVLDGAPGLTIRVDSPVYYQINGYSRSQIARQMQQCSPVESGHSAQTSYIISKTYTTTTVSPGICKVENVKVGVRIGFVYPSWQSSSHDEPGLGSNWQRFIGAVTTHENGHADLNKQYAAKIVNDLTNLPPSDCNNIYAVANGVYQSDLSGLRAANEGYDASTNHGASQGAVF